MSKLMNKIRNSEILLYTVAFALLTIMFFVPVLLRGDTLVKTSDIMDQHIAFTRMLHSVIYSGQVTDLFNLWSWHLGAGASFSESMSYYVLGDPLSWINALLPSAWIDWTFSLFQLVRVFLVGLAAVLYLRTKFEQKWPVAVAGSAYAFTLVLWASMQPMFQTTAMIFILLILAIDRLMDQGKYALFAILVTAVLIINVYAGMLSGLLAGIYFFVRWGISFDRRRSFFILIRVIGLLIIALLISAPFWSQFVRALMNSPRLGGELASGYLLYPGYYYLNILPQIFSPMYYTKFDVLIAASGVGIPATLFVLRRFKKYLAQSALLVASIVGLLLPLVPAILNGLTAPSNRWVFVVNLAIIMAILTMIRDFDSYDKKDVKFAFIGIAIYILNLLIRDQMWRPLDGFIIQNQTDQLGTLAVAVSVPVIYLMRRNNFKINFIFWLATATIAGVAYNGIYSISQTGGNFDVKRQAEYHPYSEFEKDDTQRVSYLSTNRSDSFVASFSRSNYAWFDGVMTPEMYNSMESKDVFAFSESVLNNQRQKAEVMQQLDNREELLNFVGVNQLLNWQSWPQRFSTYKESRKDSKLLKSDSALPLLYATNHVISLDDYDSAQPWERSTFLSQGIIMSGKDVKSTIKPKSFAKVISEKHDVTVSKKSGEKSDITINIPKNASKGKELLVYIEGLSYSKQSVVNQVLNAQVTDDYTYSNRLGNRRFEKLKTLKDALEQDAKGYTLSIGDNKGNQNAFYQVPQSDSSMYLQQDKGLINLGYDKKGRKSITLSLENNGALKIKTVKVVSISLNQSYKERQSELKSGAPTTLKLTDTGLVAKFPEGHSKFVGSSIPYNVGWHLYVDGKERPVYKTNVGFVGFELPDGTVSVELRYKNPIINIGLIMFLMGILLTGVLLLISRVRKASDKKAN